MPHYRCGACRTRLQIAQPPPARVVVSCPQCCSALDRVTDLTELIGLRRIAFVDEHDRPGDYFASFDEPGSAAAVAVLHPSPTQ